MCVRDGSFDMVECAILWYSCTQFIRNGYYNFMTRKSNKKKPVIYRVQASECRFSLIDLLNYDKFMSKRQREKKGQHQRKWNGNDSKKLNKYLSFSRGQLHQPVVMQKYVSCGATWWMRWCLLGRTIWWSCRKKWNQISHNHFAIELFGHFCFHKIIIKLFTCRKSTHFGKPKYVCDHLWIYIK